VTLPAAPRPVAARSEPVLILAAFAWGSAAIHAVVAVPHFHEYVPYGVAFTVLAAAQAGWGVLVSCRPTVRWLGAGMLVSVGVIAVWAISRTVGLPLGPEAGSPEPVGFADVGATLDELALVMLAAALLRGRARTLGLWARQAALIVLVFSGVALLAAGTAHG
jgi:hypothetical protein